MKNKKINDDYYFEDEVELNENLADFGKGIYKYGKKAATALDRPMAISFARNKPGLNPAEKTKRKVLDYLRKPGDKNTTLGKVKEKLRSMTGVTPTGTRADGGEGYSDIKNAVLPSIIRNKDTKEYRKAGVNYVLKQGEEIGGRKVGATVKLTGAGAVAGGAGAGVYANTTPVEDAKDAIGDKINAVKDKIKNAPTSTKVAVGAGLLGGAVLAAKLIKDTNEKIDWKLDGCDKLEDGSKKDKCKAYVLNLKIENLKDDLSRCERSSSPEDCKKIVNNKILSLKNKK